MSRVVVLGAGAMGLAAAFHGAKRGHDVTVLEAAREIGGMAAHFDFGGLSIERYYHFICRSDQATFALLEELGIASKLRWVPTSMGYYVDGRLYPWGDPLSLLKFPQLTLLEKFRYGAMMAAATRRPHAGSLENLSAREWITRWCGERVYDKLWRPLFALKFWEYAENISAAWTWARIKRIGTSRRSLLQEELGYVEGGSETLIQALAAAIEGAGGRILLNTRAEQVESDGSRVTGVTAGGQFHPADAVISTVPTPLIEQLVLGMPPEQRGRYAAVQNIGVVCVVFRLRRSVSPHFWVNISDGRFEIPGIVEFSNLRPVGDTIVYVPYYMPSTHQRFSRPDTFFEEQSFGYLKLINPELTEADRIAVHVARLRHAQPVCPPGFAAMLPPVQTSIAGLQIADTSFYYPEDRGISESVALGKVMAERIG